MTVDTVDKGSTPILGSPNRFKLAIFASNMHGGANLTFADGPPKVEWSEQRDIAIAADRAGFEALIPVARWKGMSRDDYKEGHRSFETFTWAAGLAAVTERIQVFATFHVPTTHPVRAAKEVATVDHIAGGRFGLNVVAGWNRVEFEMFGIDQREHDERYQVADEWMTFLRRIWAEDDPFDFKGAYFDSTRVISQPKPLQQPEPVVMGAGFSPAGREFAAKHADINFVILPDMQSTAATVSTLKSYARDRYDRDLRVFGAAHIVCRDTEAEARAWFDHAVYERGDWDAANTSLDLLIPNSQSADFDREGMGAAAIAGFFALPLIGTPEQVVDGMCQMADAGLDGVAVSWIDYSDGITQYAEQLHPLMVSAGLRA